MIQLAQDYVFLPQRLIADLQANPAAIGVYALIARLFLIYQAPIPLSAADLQRYDPTLSYGAARGALQRLVALRWLADQPGHKNQYTPSWGVIKGTALPWRMDAPTLGRPAHVVTLRLDRRLLDVGLGKLIPHPTYPAQTNDRYLAQPILSLRDVGAYAQVLNGQALAATPTLWRYELIRDGVAQPLASAAELIALASQRTLDGDGATPTEHGLRTLGLELSSAPPTPPPSQPLFFVDHGLIPDPISHLIPDLIPPGLETKHHSHAATCTETAAFDQSPRMAATPGILSEPSDSPSNLPTRRQPGGGGDHGSHEKRGREATQPETASARLLKSIHAFPSSITELADMPAELVERAIAYAEAEPGIASIAGWVVEALRKQRDQGWPIPAARRLDDTANRDRPLDIEHYTSGAYGDLFRRGSDTSGLEAYAVDREDGAFAAPNGNLLEQSPAEFAGPPARSTPPDAALAPADDVLTRQVQEELMWRCGRQRGRVIAGLRVHRTDATTLLICATVEDMAIVQHELIGAIQSILVRLGVPPQLAFTARGGWDARSDRIGNVSSGSAPQMPGE